MEMIYITLIIGRGTWTNKQTTKTFIHVDFLVKKSKADNASSWKIHTCTVKSTTKAKKMLKMRRIKKRSASHITSSKIIWDFNNIKTSWSKNLQNQRWYLLVYYSSPWDEFRNKVEMGILEKGKKNRTLIKTCKGKLLVLQELLEKNQHM